VRLDNLIADYRALGPALRGGSPEEGWWDSFRRELGSIVSVHRADSPSPQPQARYDRALARLEAGEVDAALAETMRLPGATNAGQWVVRARRYIAAHRALDEIEFMAAAESPNPPVSPR
jgi:predicted Zn-dependent protease